jgi:hypothetical protein
MPTPPLQGDIKDYRQPMVTSLGIIMGFLLNFLASWAVEDDVDSAIQTAADWSIVLTLLLAILLMLLVLYRLLNNRIDPADAARHYQTTFRVYIASLGIAFIGVIAALFL